MSKQERDYDEFTLLKDQKCSEITEANAADRLKTAASQTVHSLQQLNVKNITQVEDLYLIIAQLALAASYVAAQDKATIKNISFDDALHGIGTPEVIATLNKVFNKSDFINFPKFIAIDELYKPVKQAWSGLNARMDEIARQYHRESLLNVLNENVPAYKKHLEEKLKNNGIDINNREIKDDDPPVIQKLIHRYNAIVGLNEKINSPSNLKIEEEAKKSMQVCLANKPDWSERPLIQKITDFLSLGFKPLYRAFFSKEKDFQESMDNILKPPRM